MLYQVQDKGLKILVNDCPRELYCPACFRFRPGHPIVLARHEEMHILKYSAVVWFQWDGLFLWNEADERFCIMCALCATVVRAVANRNDVDLEWI